MLVVVTLDVTVVFVFAFTGIFRMLSGSIGSNATTFLAFGDSTWKAEEVGVRLVSVVLPRTRSF